MSIKKEKAALIAMQQKLIEKREAVRQELADENLIFDNITAFWGMTRGKYKTLGELMESPEGVALRKLWIGELAQKYPRFVDFVASPAADQWRQKYFPNYAEASAGKGGATA